MKTLILILVLILCTLSAVCGWFARDVLEVQVQYRHVSADIPSRPVVVAPSTPTVARVVPRPVTRPPPATTLARPVPEQETVSTGLAVANKGLWRVHPTRATTGEPSAWSSSPYHGEPRDP